MDIINSNDVVEFFTLDMLGEVDDLYHELLKNCNCTYLTYMVEWSGKKIYFSSNNEWRNVFIKNKLINVCPIYRNAFEGVKTRKVVISAWDHVRHDTGEQMDIMDLRNHFNIGHGLGLAIDRDGVRESLVFASTIKNVNFHVEMSRSYLIDRAINQFRRVFKHRLV
jgi:hypothetical protein